MPMRKSHTDEDREANIQEMVAAGHDPDQAVAAAYANQKKYKKMADGGIVTNDYDEDASSDMDQEADRSVNELQDLAAQHPEIIQNPEQHKAEMELAKKLHDEVESQELYSGGLVEDFDTNAEEPKKTKIVADTGAPMSTMPYHAADDEWSAAARAAIAKKKKVGYKVPMS